MLALPRIEIFNPYVRPFTDSQNFAHNDKGNSIIGKDVETYINTNIDSDGNKIVCKCTPCQCCACR